MNKKAIAILGAIFILIVAALGTLIYLRSRSDNDSDQNTSPIIEPTPEPTIDNQPTPIEIIPSPEPTIDDSSSAQGRAVRLSDDPILSPVLFLQGNGITYFGKNGELFRTQMEITSGTALLSNKQQISLPAKQNISKVIWPVTGNSFMAEIDGLNKKTWSYYDSNKGEYVDLPKEVYSFDWLPGGEKIMFIWVDENDKAFLNIANPDTSEYKVLTDIYEPDNVIKVSPDGKNILFHRTQQTDFSKNRIIMVSSDGKNFKTIIQDGYNYGIKWAPDSKKFLFTRRDSSGKFILWSGNIETNEIQNLYLATSVDKAVWGKTSQSVFVAVPKKGVAGEGVTEDTFYQIDIASGSQTELDPGLAVDGQELFLSKDESVLFFRNNQDQALYYLPVQLGSERENGNNTDSLNSGGSGSGGSNTMNLNSNNKNVTQ